MLQILCIFLTMYSISLAVGYTSERNLLWIQTQSLMKSSFSISGKLPAVCEQPGSTETTQAATTSVPGALGRPGMGPGGLASKAAAGSERECASQVCHALLTSALRKRKTECEFISSLKKWVSPYMVCSSICVLSPVFSVVLSDTAAITTQGFTRLHRAYFWVGGYFQRHSEVSRNNSLNFYRGSGG